MAGGLITDYLKQGVAASRPAAPDAATGTLSFYFATDTETLSFYDWNDTAWQDIAGTGGLLAANNLSDLASAATARTNLGLGTLATQSGTFSGTSSGTNTGDQTITLTGDVTGSGTGSFAATLANTAVTPGSYTSADITVDAKGRITAAANGSGGGGSGTVTSVSGTGTVNGLTLTGTVTTSGSLTLGGTLTGVALTANNLSDLANAATARTNLGVNNYMFGFFFTSTPTASEVLALHVAGAAFTIAANFSGALQSSVGTNPTASFALDVQKNGSTIGTITVGTGGAVTAATTSGTSKSIAAGDVLKIVAPGSADATAANMAFTLIGAR